MDSYLENIFKNVDPNIKLDKNQKQIVLDDSKNIIVVAGAGSGKTTTITAKVKYLVEIKKINPKNILIISFTNKSINELKDRINSDFNLPVQIYTFHKFAYQIVKQEDSRYKIIDDNSKILKDIIKKNKDTKKLIKIIKKNKTYRKKKNKFLSEENNFINYTVENINLYKVNYLNIKITNATSKKIKNYFEYLKNICNSYNEYLERNYLLDFEDIILKATTYVKKEYINYKYIIIDEYQDISINRFNLIKKITDICNVNILVVGDDWQAIFSFTGSDSDLFINYQKLMNAKMFKIINTYRNSQELIDVAGNFVMKNKKQIKKNLVSKKHIDYPVEIYFYKKNISEIILEIIEKIILEYGVSKNILILGRYKNDILRITSSELQIKNNNVFYKKYPSLKIEYMTAHASKGLGYDNVILINALNDEYGFPSKIKNDEIKKIISGIENNMLEERRLFYVAMTRTKNKFYIITNKKNKSIFIKELVNNQNVKCFYKTNNNKNKKTT